MHHSGGGKSLDIIDNMSHYVTLGLGGGGGSQVSQKDIKKAYLKLAKLHHPDRGGEEAAFKRVGAAYEVLGEPTKRALYDEGGDEAVEQGTSRRRGGGFPHHHSGGKQLRQPQPPADMEVTLIVTLLELYRGATRQVEIDYTARCQVCNGACGTGKLEECSDCKGLGVKRSMRALGPGMMQQIQQECKACSGVGETMPAASACKPCRGKGTTMSRKTLQVAIRPGQLTHVPVWLRDVGNEAASPPDTRPGDVLVILECRDANAQLKVHGKHLVYHHTLNVLDALTGATFDVPHLQPRLYSSAEDEEKKKTAAAADKKKKEEPRLVRVQTPAGKVVRPDAFMVLPGEGMPAPNNPFVFGDLYIQFSVEFPPDDFCKNDAQRALLRKSWPTAAASKSSGDRGGTSSSQPIEQLLAAGGDGGNGSQEEGATDAVAMLKPSTVQETKTAFEAEATAIRQESLQFKEEFESSRRNSGGQGQGKGQGQGQGMPPPGCTQQ